MIIYWSQFTWEAFATLVAGAGAVVGAIWVGIRQSAISRRQVSIEELSLRIELFDRRFAVYEATEAYLVQAINIDGPKSKDVERAFFDAKKRSSFLFSAATQAKLKEIATTATKLMSIGSKLRPTNIPDGPPDWDLSHLEQSCLEVLVNHYENLPSVFGDDMELIRTA